MAIQYLVKAAISDPTAIEYVFENQKTMYGGKHIAKGDTVFVFASETDGGQGLLCKAIVTWASATPLKTGVQRQTPRVSIAVRRTCSVSKRLGCAELKAFCNWEDGRPETELNFKFYRQATNKIGSISEEAAGLLTRHLTELR